MKKWAQDIHDDCLANGAYATAKKHDMSIEDVKSTTLNAAGWETLWIDFLNHHDSFFNCATSHHFPRSSRI